jgi:hypothetical protein
MGEALEREQSVTQSRCGFVAIDTALTPAARHEGGTQRFADVTGAQRNLVRGLRRTRPRRQPCYPLTIIDAH